MKVLVTGHHGYIGSVTVPVLRAAGHDVTGLDSLLYDGCDLYDGEGPPSALRVDVRDVEPGHLEGFDAVVHLAALSNDPLGDLDPELTMAINYEGTVRVARAAKEAGVGRFVFASSCSMYGAADSNDPVDESAPLSPLTAYAESKVRSEEVLADMASDGFAPVFMRNATAYGASPRLRLDIVLNNLVGWALTTGAVRILSDGTPWRPLVHVEDIARATLGVLEAPEGAIRGQAFNVGRDDENYQVRELAEVVQRTVGDCTVEFGGSGDPDPRSYRVDFGKFAAAFPDVRLSWTAERGAAELLDAYRAAGMTFDDFDGDRFTRLKHLRERLARGDLDEDLRPR
ncbi:MAG TPA: SDR family oxidoreductase [Gaiellaceae bacterium]